MKKPLLIGIAGGSGSGKTTLADLLIEKYGIENVVSISQDSFYKDLSTLKKEERDEWNFDHPDAIDWKQMTSTLHTLRANRSTVIPQYDFGNHSRNGYKQFHPAKIIIVEGHLILARQEIVQLLDYKVFLELDIDLLFIRRLQRDKTMRQRDTVSICKQYLETVRPALFEYVLPSSALADIVIDLEKETECLQLIIKKISHHFSTIDNPILSFQTTKAKK